MRVLILFGTSEGHTHKVARYLSDVLSSQGYVVTIADAKALPVDLDLIAFDLVIIAARVHSGTYPRTVIDFVRKQRATLQEMPTAFVSVSMAASHHRHGDEKREASYVDRFISKTGWTPQHIHHAAGARLYMRHDRFTRWILGMVDGHRYDTRRDHEFTDWDKLSTFADKVALSVGRHQQQKQFAAESRPAPATLASNSHDLRT